jgi:dTDP-4-dehydrorhamnose reductase
LKMIERLILIVGKNGQLARCLRDWTGQHQLNALAVGRAELDLEKIGSLDEVVATISPSVIINAAAYTAVDRAETESASAFAINCNGAALLAGAAARQRIPLIHISTDYVFDGNKKSSYQEDDGPAPLNVYGESKLAGEAAVLGACPCAVVVRTAWVYSPYGSNFVRTMHRLSATQSTVGVVDDQRGTPTSAIDLAEALLTIAKKLREPDGCRHAGIYHLAGNGEASWHEFASTIFASLASRGRRVPRLQAIPTAEYPTPARRPRNSCLDSSKAADVFGVRLPPWQSSLEVCLDRMEVHRELHAC